MNEEVLTETGTETIEETGVDSGGDSTSAVEETISQNVTEESTDPNVTAFETENNDGDGNPAPTEETTDQETSEPTEDETFSTPAVELPPLQPDMHRGTIIAVTSQTAETGSTAIVVALQSQDDGSEHSLQIWVPGVFADNENWKGGKFNIEVLSEDVSEGKKQSPKERFARVVQNNAAAGKDENGQKITGNAELQVLRRVAFTDGRTTKGLPKVTDFDTFVASHNELLSGVECFFTRKVESDETYGDKLKVAKIYGKDVTDTKNFGKNFKGFLKRWEE